MSNEIKDWVLVPRDPSAEMLDAAIDAHIGFDGEDEVDAVWATMLKAAPTPPAEAQVGVKGLIHDIDWIAWNLIDPDKAARSKHRGVDAIRHVVENLRRKVVALSAQPRQDTFTERHAELLKSVRVGETLTQEQWESVCAYVIEGDEVIDKQNERLADLASAPVGVDARILELADRLVAAGPKAAHVSASECHELRDFIHDLAQQPAAVDGVDWKAMYRIQTAMRYMDNLPEITRDAAFRMSDEDCARLESQTQGEG